ncbi:DUF3077 domain-containing protein [Pseudomonas chlororaphis]|uniref:DUF6124 family protein n=1 Tax=Pseudomonas chlororaphis TaxID=587753 RepID=UPI001E3E6CAF|nr:DUF3077 domain-containing protein [Pseudomonas chlororaphis]MCB2251003.1 DUF3077 domain-containing protein [Pseudomonas chlororaphis]
MKKLIPVYRCPELKTANQTLRQALASSPPESLDSLHATKAGPVSPDSLFCVRQGISAEEALVHVSLLLKCAEEVSDEITERGSGLERGLIWSMVHSVEMARAVVDALLDGRGGR